MIEDETHPEYVAIKNALFGQIAMIAAREPLTTYLILGLQQICDSATKQAKAHGIGFPDMIVAWFFPSRLVRVYRRDADAKLVQDYVNILIRDAPELKYWELHVGFSRTFPAYKIEDFLDFRFDPETFEKRATPKVSQPDMK